MTRARNAAALALLLACCLAAPRVSGQDAPPAHRRQRVLANVGASLFLPTRSERPIDTVYLDCAAGVEIWDLLGVDIYGGLTLAMASGSILQPDEMGTEVRYGTAVMGFGPTFLFRVEPLRVEGFSLAVDALGSLLFYTAPFPPGGDVYDFAWRIGGTLGYAFTPSLRVELGVRWMHVSNGQGIGAFNPAYEGLGGTLAAQIRI